MTDHVPSKRKRRRTTVGSIVVPELPWQRARQNPHLPNGYAADLIILDEAAGLPEPDTRAMDLLREDDPPLTQEQRERAIEELR